MIIAPTYSYVERVMNLRDLRIGTRLGVSFGLILALLTVIVVSTTLLTAQNKNNLMVGLAASNERAVLVVAMKSALLESGIAMRNMLDPVVVEKQKRRVDIQNRRYVESREKLTSLNLSDAEKEIIFELEKLDKSIQGRYNQAIIQAESLNSEGAASIITRYIDPLTLKELVEIDKLVELEQNSARLVLSDSVAADRKLTILLFSIFSAALMIGSGLAWTITRGIVKPLNEAVAVADRVAAGDLTSNIQSAGKNEIGYLLDALCRMNRGLGEMVEKVRIGTETIGIVSREMAAGNSDLSVRTETQAASLEKTAFSVEDLASTVRKNSESAHHANQLVQSASNVAVRGGKVVGDVVATMASIKGSSNKIVEIISVIDGIAFQTNILALNAAVEAARAGEQGRGFAVVAAEVRSLAQRSAAAAKEIKELIDDSVEKIDAGSKLVTAAGGTMGEIVTNVKKVADIMADILTASDEQSAGIESVNEAIGQIDQATQQNAALVEQAAAAASSMQDQAANLAQSVSAFKLNTAQLAAIPIAAGEYQGRDHRVALGSTILKKRRYVA
jgi:methyl-accepting chemotaxis protein